MKIEAGLEATEKLEAAEGGRARAHAFRDASSYAH